MTRSPCWTPSALSANVDVLQVTDCFRSWFKAPLYWIIFFSLSQQWKLTAKLPRSSVEEADAASHASHCWQHVCVPARQLHSVHWRIALERQSSSFSRKHRLLSLQICGHSNIPTGTPITGASNAGGVGKNHDSEPISGFTACVNAATGRCCKHGRRWTRAT